MTFSRSDLLKVCSWSDYGKGGSESYVLYAVKDKPELFVVYCDSNLMGWESESWRLIRKTQHPGLIPLLKRKGSPATKMTTVEALDLERVEIVK